MTVICFEGPPRTGKTLFMTFHAYHNYINERSQIFSNYKLMFEHVMMSPYDMLAIPFNDIDRHHKTLCIQEADKWFDSHRSMRSENVLLSSLTGQSGKRNLDILYDTQFYNRIEKSLRDVTEIIFHAHVYTSSKTKEPIAFQYTSETRNGEFKELPYIPAPVLEPFYSIYDSYEATQPLTSTKSLEDIMSDIKDARKNSRKKRN